jgi:hypothetical protein
MQRLTLAILLLALLSCATAFLFHSTPCEKCVRKCRGKAYKVEKLRCMRQCFKEGNPCHKEAPVETEQDEDNEKLCNECMVTYCKNSCPGIVCGHCRIQCKATKWCRAVRK